MDDTEDLRLDLVLYDFDKDINLVFVGLAALAFW